MNLKLADLREWITKLPEELDEFELIHAIEGALPDGHSYRLDSPIVSLAVDEGCKEILFFTDDKSREINEQ